MGILDRVVKASSAEAPAFVNILVHGLSGTGKTTLGALSGKNPLIVTAERQAVLVIQQTNPNANVLIVDTWGDLQNLFKEINEMSMSGPLPWDVIVLDSLTEMQRRLKDEILRTGHSKKHVQDDGSLTMAGWGVVVDKAFNLVRSFRDLPCDFICICLSEETQPEEGVRFYRPSVSGKKLPGDLAGLFNAVFFSFTSNKNRLKYEPYIDGSMQYVLLTRGSSGEYLTKGHAAMNELEDSNNIRDIIERLKVWKRGNPQAPDYITSEQAAKISDALVTADMAEEDYCKAMKVSSLAETPANQFDKIMKKLAKRAMMVQNYTTTTEGEAA